MIPSKALKKFIARKRDDHRQWQDYSEEKLDRLAAALPFHPPIWRKLQRKQKVSLLLGAKYKRFLFLNDTGTGKTMTCIALSRYFIECGAKGIFLALVPRKTNKVEWKREIEKHSPASRALVLEGSSIKKWEALRSTNADIVIETYSGLIRMLCGERQDKKGNTRLKPEKRLVGELKKLVSGLFLDESTEVKNKAKLPYRLCRALSKAAPYTFVLTATPMGVDPKDIWAQANLVDDGWSLGETLGLFRAAFYTEKAGYWGNIEYHFEKRKHALLHQFLRHRSIRFEAEEGEKPDLRFFKIYCKMSSDAASYYAIHREKLLKSYGNYKEQESAFVRMRQISSGYVGYRDEDTNAKAEIAFTDQPKLDELVKFLWAHDGKAIVFHEYRPTGSLISCALAQEGIGHELLNGGNSDDAERILKRFDKDPNCEVLAVNNAMGSFGLNLQVARWGIFFESPVSPIVRRQAIARWWRQFSKHSWVGLLDLITENTVDEQILENIKQGDNLFQKIVRGAVRAR